MENLVPEAVSIEEALTVPTIMLVVVIGETNRVLSQANVPGSEALSARDYAVVTTSLVNCAVVFARREGHPGAPLSAVIGAARRYASDHPGELAAYDQAFADFCRRFGHG